MAKFKNSKRIVRRILITGALSLLVGILMVVLLIAVLPRTGTIRHILRDPVEAFRSFWRAHRKELIEDKDDRLKRINAAIEIDHKTLGHMSNDLRDLRNPRFQNKSPTSRAVTTPTSRSVPMISRNYNPNPVIDVRLRW